MFETMVPSAQRRRRDSPTAIERTVRRMFEAKTTIRGSGRRSSPSPRRSVARVRQASATEPPRESRRLHYLRRPD